MRKSTRSFGFLCAALLGGAFILGSDEAQAQTTKQYIIVAKQIGKPRTSLLSAVAAAQGTVLQTLDEPGLVLAASSNPDFAASLARDRAVQEVAEDLEVQWISPNEFAVEVQGADFVPAGVSSEPLGFLQWNLPQIHADATAAGGNFGEGAVVAVIDTGINTGHLDLVQNIDFAHSKAFVQSTLYPAGFPAYEDDVFHGSHVAGIIAAAINNFGVQGVAPRAKIVAVKVLNDKGSGTFWNIISGIEYAVSLQVDVINMSLGATFDRNKGVSGFNAGPLIAALNRAINHATAAGVLVVSAAGNQGVDLNGRYVSVPAQSGNGMAVSATGPIGLLNFDRLASYSNYGRSVIDVAAPGGDATLYTEDPANPNYGTWFRDMVASCGNRDPAHPNSFGSVNRWYFAAGTSMAAPHVSGVAALIVGKYGKLPPAQIKALIEHSADDILKPGADAESGRGRINALRALQ